jgi:hypothetical protein
VALSGRVSVDPISTATPFHAPTVNPLGLVHASGTPIGHSDRYAGPEGEIKELILLLLFYRRMAKM